MLNGYAVVTNLIEHLKVELANHVKPELIRDHIEFASAVSGFDQRAFATRMNEIADGLTGVSSQNGPFIEKLSSSLARVLQFQVNSYVNNLAASLVEDMLSFFILPLIRQLSDARERLQSVPKAELLPSGAKNPYKNFPDWSTGIVPNRYKSRTIERILIDFTEYESTYEFYASKDSNGAPPFQQSVSSSLLGKKMNPMPGDLNEQTLITVNSQWITSVRDAQGSMGAAVNKSDWKFHTDLAVLSENNRRWLKNEDSSFGKFTDMSIRTFISADSESAKIRGDRESKFVKEYEAMLKIAAPLILLNPKASEHVIAAADGGNALRILVESNKIPFDINSNVGQSCTVVLQQRGYNPSDPGFASKWFDAGSNASEMFASSTHMASLPAWTFASLTEPILEQVAKSKNKVQTWDQFWDGRRSRPLIEAIPFETEMRRSMITGWFVATLFGMRKVESVPAGRTAKIWNPTLQVPGWSTFPSPLISTAPADTKRESWILPQLLVSAGIALAEFGKSGSPEFIYGYRLLKFLGREVTTSFENRDHWDGRGSGDMLPTGMPAQSQFIKDWVEFGTKPADSLELLPLLQNNLLTISDRGAALIASVETLRSEYASIWDSGQVAAWNDLSETWELREDIDLALSDIGTYVAELHITTAMTSD